MPEDLSPTASCAVTSLSESAPEVTIGSTTEPVSHFLDHGVVMHEPAADGLITRALHRLEAGEIHAREELFELVYGELRQVAANRLRVAPKDSLHPTALVNEMYVRMFGTREPTPYANRKHFFFAAARAMKHILIERARRKACVRHGGHLQAIPFDESAAQSLQSDPMRFLELMRALDALRDEDSRAASLVDLRFFGGLTHAEAASVLGISEKTAQRDWAFAKAQLWRTFA